MSHKSKGWYRLLQVVYIFLYCLVALGVFAVYQADHPHQVLGYYGWETDSGSPTETRDMFAVGAVGVIAIEIIANTTLYIVTGESPLKHNTLLGFVIREGEKA